MQDALHDFAYDSAGQRFIDVENTEDGSRITLYQQGAHLTSWRTRDGDEQLYLSPKAAYAAGKPIRGGVPLIFPQFSDLGPLKGAHGFLRVRSQWTVASNTQQGQERIVILKYRLKPGDEPEFADANCTLFYSIIFDASTLTLRMTIENKASEHETPLTFAFAFHTYFRVDDVREISIHGLDDTQYLDNLQARARCAAQPMQTISGEVDRIYMHQQDAPVTITSGCAKMNAVKTFTVRGDNFEDVVLWNPWVEKSRLLADLPSDDYKRFVCVEHGVIVKQARLLPGQRWSAAQIVSVAFS